MTKEEAWDILAITIEKEYPDNSKETKCTRIMGTYYGLKAIMSNSERSEHREV